MKVEDALFTNSQKSQTRRNVIRWIKYPKDFPLMEQNKMIFNKAQVSLELGLEEDQLHKLSMKSSDFTTPGVERQDSIAS